MNDSEPKTFVARVQVGDRIQIPEPVKTIMQIKEGDYLEVTIRKLPPPPKEEKLEKL